MAQIVKGAHRIAPQAVDPSAIERELTALWAELDKQHHEGAIIRAVMSNLMIYCEGEEEVREVTERIPELVQYHPARVLVIVADATLQQSLSAWVSAHCRRLGPDTQLCAEHVEVHFSPGAVERAASVIRSLLIGDLPSAIWWYSSKPPVLCGDVFEELAGMAQQIIYDSTGWPHPVRGVRAMAQWIGSGEEVVYNLAWRRLKPWRRILAQSLEPDVAPGALDGLEEMEIEHGPHALPLVWLLVGWLASRLQWKVEQGKARDGKQIEWSFTSHRGTVRVRVLRLAAGETRIERLRLRWHNRTEHTSGHALYVQEPHHLRIDEAHSSLHPAVIPSPQPTPEKMIAAQLAHRAGDQLFAEVARIAYQMAEVVDQD